MQNLFERRGENDASGATVAAGAERFARVVVERGLEAVESARAGLTYALRDDEPVDVGDRVEVPLGRSTTGGIVVEVGGRNLLGELPLSKVKAVLRRSGAGLPATLLDLARWMSEYYVCPLGMVLATMLPAAVKQAVGRRTIELIDLAPGTGEIALPDITAQQTADAAGKPEIGRATRSAMPLKPQAARASAAIRSLPPGTLPLGARDLATAIGERTIAPINRLIEAGLLVRVRKQIVVPPRQNRDDWILGTSQAGSPPPLTSAQARAVEGINAEAGGFGVHLLWGVTASGKTEVYLRLIERVLSAGRDAIVLVPEISLTPQTAGRFLARFGRERVAVLHSGLSAAQRNHQWAMASSGQARVVIGARSAVFAPLTRLGLIVVDEEHATDYKQDQLPRYHARDTAIKRGQVQGCAVVLGSATPSLESWANAVGDRPRYRLWTLPDRVGTATLPRIETVDLSQDRRARVQGGGPAAFRLVGTRLSAELDKTLRAGGQAILLLNRRGFANYISCPSAVCGWVLGCDDCDSNLVLHRGKALPKGTLLRCHHCLAERLVPSKCPACGGKLVTLGMGTQRLEDELAERFGLRSAWGTDEPRDGTTGEVPQDGAGERRRMLRVDGDTMRSARDYAEALGEFAKGTVQVLLGTQMISKGLDFPNVRLVGVINADTALAVPDFRAAERTFQLVSQVAGRAGRGSEPGLVIVQSMGPASAAIHAAAAHDFERFATRELAIRRAAGLPPAARMARIICRDRNRTKATEAAAVLSERLGAAAGAGVRVEPPVPCPIERIAGFWRIELLILAPTARALLAPMAAVRAAGLLKSDSLTAVDVDPVSLA